MTDKQEHEYKVLIHFVKGQPFDFITMKSQTIDDAAWTFMLAMEPSGFLYTYPNDDRKAFFPHHTILRVVSVPEVVDRANEMRAGRQLKAMMKGQVLRTGE